MQRYKVLHAKFKKQHEVANMTSSQTGIDSTTLRELRQNAIYEVEEATTDLENAIYTRRPVIHATNFGQRLFGHFHSVCTLEKKPRHDYYVPTVLVQFLALICVAAGYRTFQPANSPNNTLTANSVPVGYLLSLLAVFVVIVVDRALYMLRAMRTKLILHFVLVFIVHLFMFFLLPLKTNRSFPHNGAAIFFYLVFMTYFMLSAAQLRSGYPVFVLGNALTRNVTTVGYIIYIIYRAIPFLHEIRVSVLGSGGVGGRLF